MTTPISPNHEKKSERPKEIQQLIEWLREPGRKLPFGYGSDEMPCARHRLHQICGDQWRSEKILGTAERWNALAQINDGTQRPIAVAEYLEREFPLTSDS